jgi:hypothetical protein
MSGNVLERLLTKDKLRHIMRLLPLTAILLALAPAPAAAAPLAVHVNQAGFAARGFRSGLRSRPRVSTRPRYAPRSRYARPHYGRRLFRGFLHALGLAYLAHLLFGWGAGGSPFGLLLLGALVLWLVTRRRRRPAYRGW